VIVLAREITKIHEEVLRGKVKEIFAEIGEPKGEFAIIIKGNKKDKKEVEIENLNKGSLEEHYKYYEEKNIEKKDIIKKIAKDRKINKNEIYQYFLNK